MASAQVRGQRINNSRRLESWAVFSWSGIVKQQHTENYTSTQRILPRTTIVAEVRKCCSVVTTSECSMAGEDARAPLRSTCNGVKEQGASEFRCLPPQSCLPRQSSPHAGDIALQYPQLVSRLPVATPARTHPRPTVALLQRP